MANFAAWENAHDKDTNASIRYEWLPNIKDLDAEDTLDPEYLDDGQLIRRKYDDILLMWNDGTTVAFCNINEAETFIGANDPDTEFVKLP